MAEKQQADAPGYLPEAHGHQEDVGRSYCGWKGHGDCAKKPAGKPVSSGMRVPT